jgi:hypothetical protein
MDGRLTLSLSTVNFLYRLNSGDFSMKKSRH